MKIKDIQVNPNSFRPEEILKLSPETQVRPISVDYTIKGTGLREVLYQIVGTDDGFVVYTTVGHGGVIYQGTQAREGYFKQAREFGKKAYQLSIRHELPWEVIVALKGDEENVKKFKNLMAKKASLTSVKERVKNIYGSERINILKEVLPGVDLEGISYHNANRIVDYLMSE